MVSVDEHLAHVLSGAHPLEALEVGLLDAHGCVLAEDVVAGTPMPGFDNSGMDGYAVRAADVAGASATSPVVLPVVGDVKAGPVPPLRVQEGLCVRIMTGAAVPPGADAVVPLEDTDRGVARVEVRAPAAPGAHVRRAGEDVEAGTVVVAAGTVLGAAHLGLVAASGRTRVLARPRPRVVVISTGDELVDPGEPLTPGMLPDSNSWALTAAAREAGAVAYRVGPVGDDPAAFRRLLEDQLVRADVVVSTGGVSAGAYDVVKAALESEGQVRFDAVDMRPGKPQAFGHIGPDAVPFFGLPGNPVSALVSFEVFVRPLLRTLLGAATVHRPQVSARALETFESPGPRRSFLRGRIEVVDGEYAVRPVGGQGSHQLSSFAAASCLVVVPEQVQRVNPGEVVRVLMLERRAQ